MKRYVGLDVHKRTIVACLLDSEGHLVRRITFDCTRTEITKFAQEQLERSDVVTLEATTNWNSPGPVDRSLCHSNNDGTHFGGLSRYQPLSANAPTALHERPFLRPPPLRVNHATS
jgi:hypothetical protein